MRLKDVWWLLLIIPGALWYGGDGVYEYVQARSVEVIPCDALASAPPKGVYLRVTGCVVDLVGAAYLEKKKGLQVVSSEVIAPLRRPNASQGELARIFVSTRDPKALDLVGRMIAYQLHDDRMAQLFKDQGQALRAKRDVEGLARRGFRDDGSTRSEVERLSKNAGSDFVILDEGRQPELLLPALALALGLAGIAGIVAMALRHRKQAWRG